MQIRPFSADPNAPTSVTLLDNSTIPYSSITYDTNSGRFSYTPSGGGDAVDVTFNMTRADKATFPGFDVVKDNNLLSYYVGGHTTYGANNVPIPDPGAPLPTSTAGIFEQNLKNDVTLGQGSITKQILQYAAYAVVGYVIFNLILSQSRK